MFTIDFKTDDVVVYSLSLDRIVAFGILISCKIGKIVGREQENKEKNPSKMSGNFKFSTISSTTFSMSLTFDAPAHITINTCCC